MKKFVLAVSVLLFYSGLSLAADSDLTTSNLQTMIITQGAYATKYSLKVDAENSGAAGDASIHVVAKNRDGFQVNEVFFTGQIGAGEKKVFTTTDTIKRDIADTIQQWEIDRIRKFDK